MFVGHPGLHRAGAMEWILEEEEKHVRQILSESFVFSLLLLLPIFIL